MNEFQVGQKVKVLDASPSNLFPMLWGQADFVGVVCPIQAIRTPPEWPGESAEHIYVVEGYFFKASELQAV